jgi:hypothetical protein
MRRAHVLFRLQYEIVVTSSQVHYLVIVYAYSLPHHNLSLSSTYDFNHTTLLYINERFLAHNLDMSTDPLTVAKEAERDLNSDAAKKGHGISDSSAPILSSFTHTLAR